MNEEELFKLAVNLVCADIQSARIAPSMAMGRLECIEDQIIEYHEMLRKLWREQNIVINPDNVEPMNH